MDRWEEYKERLRSLRAEYALLFPHLHFLQGLRFAMLGVMLPIFGTLINFYRLAIHPVGKDAFRDPMTGAGVSILALSILWGIYHIEIAIMRQTRTVIRRGSQIENTLGVIDGTLGAIQSRMATSILQRTSGRIIIGYIVSAVLWMIALSWSIYLLSR